MDVCIVGMEWPPVTGGAGRALQGFLVGTGELRRQSNCKLTVLVPGQDKHLYSSIWAPDIVLKKLPSGKIMKRKGRLKAAARFWWEATQQIMSLAPDVVHVWGGGPGLYAAPGHKPYIVTLHGSDVPGRNPQRDRLWKYAIGYRKRLERAHAVTAVTRRLCDLAKDYIRRDVEYIPNGTNSFDRKQQLRPNCPPRVLVVTRLTPLKRLGLLSQVMSWAKSFTFTVVGDGPERQYCEQWAIPNVRWLGWQQDMYRHYADHDILLNVADVTGMSMAIIEALGHGLPVVSTPIPDLPPKFMRAIRISHAVTPGKIVDKLVEVRDYYTSRARDVATIQPALQWSYTGTMYYELYKMANNR